MRWRHLAMGGAALLAAATLGCGRGDEGGAEEKTPEPVVSVRMAALEARRFDDLVSASGQWRSGGELVLSAPFAGVVETLTVRVGDRVAAGQRVGALLTRDSWAALRGAELLAREARDPDARAEAARALALARRDLVRVPLTAPQAGVVVRRSVEPGAQVAEAAEVAAISPARSVVFEAHVPAAQAGRLRPGQPATVRGEGVPPRAATVQRLLPMANSADQATMVWLAPRAPDPPPELDRFGTADIVVGAPRRVLAVPDSAVVEDDLTGEHRLAVVDSTGRAAWTPVRLGAAEDGWRELVGSALAPGTRVVVEGQRGLPGGTRVKPLP